jgi:predicted permease
VNLFSWLRSGISALLQRSWIEDEVDEELRSHIEDRAKDLERSGVPKKEAERRARLEFGGYQKFKQECRELQGGNFLDTVIQDTRHGLRMLRKSPGFTVVAVLTLALGIGANTAIFTMINGLMLNALPVRDPGQLVEILHHYRGEPEPGYNGFSWDAYQTIRDGNDVFSDVLLSSLNFFTVNADGLEPQKVFGGVVGGTFFQSLGVQAAAGRLIGPDDVHPGSHEPVAVVSWSFWKSRFNLDPTMVGKHIIVNDTPVTIIGVTQRGFYGLSREAQQDVWLPISLGPAPGWGFGLLARLKPGVSIAQARTEMAVLFQTIVNAPDAGPFVKEMTPRIEPAGNGVSTPLSQMLSMPLRVLMATVGLLLLLACANLAGLLLARGASRRHEMAVRACLGAPRSRLLRQTLTESLLLSVMGCAAGLLVAYLVSHALIRVFASARFVMGLPVHFEAMTTPDSHVFAFTATIALLAGLLFGAAPAMSASNSDPAFALQQSARIGESKSRRLFGKALVTSQVGLSFLLVSSAALFVGYLSNLQNINLGFERRDLMVVSLDVAHIAYRPAQFSQLSQELVARLNAIPGVSSSTFSDMSPMQGPGSSSFANAQDHPDKKIQVSINYVAPMYFATYRTPFLAGRDFTATDQAGPAVAIINQTAARDCFGSENPVGKHITLSHITQTEGDRTVEVVGVAGDAKYNDLQQPAPPTIYANLLQQGFIGNQLAIRTRIDPSIVVSAVRRTVADVLKNVTFDRITTMNEQVDSSIVPQRLIAMLSAGFAALGGLLALLGLYGLLAYTVASRTREIGVRMALGAAPTDVVHIVFRDVLWMVGAGLVIGAPFAFWGQRVASSVIPDLPTASYLSIVVGAAVMIAVGLVAAYLPARRAVRVDPLVALRYE